MLLELKQHLQSHSSLSLRELASAVNCDPTIVRLAIQHWIRKGCVGCRGVTPTNVLNVVTPEVPRSKKSCGQSCQGCVSNKDEIYYWLV